MKLTTKEIEVCNMVKAGLSNIDISRLQYISPKTVEGHRKSIRQKLGLTGKKINLTSYLQQL
jgi:DNA-binding CsgD family transcriptional regulator